MIALDPVIIAVILVLVAIGAAWTIRTFRRRRDIDHRGTVKGTADPREVRRDNPPDRFHR
jgi:hypothetical protein